MYGRLKGCIVYGKRPPIFGSTVDIWYAHRNSSIGPIVRINPTELHVNDIEFCDEIYASGSRQRDMYDFFRRGLDAPLSLGGTIEHEVHRHRRDALHPYFSQENVTKLESLIQDKISLLCDRTSNMEQPIILINASLALTVDIVGQFAYLGHNGAAI